MLPRRLVQLRIDDPEPMLYHGEPILRDGAVVGDVRAGSYGHTLGGAVGIAHVCPSDIAGGEPEFVTKKYIESGTWEVDIAGRRYPATLSLRPMYDPNNEAIKG